MRERIVERAETLIAELRMVVGQLRQLQDRAAHLQDRRVRLEGAIQALTDLAREGAEEMVAETMIDGEEPVDEGKEWQER